jgi:hypothetical protein
MQGTKKNWGCSLQSDVITQCYAGRDLLAATAGKAGGATNMTRLEMDSFS